MNPAHWRFSTSCSTIGSIFPESRIGVVAHSQFLYGTAISHPVPSTIDSLVGQQTDLIFAPLILHSLELQKPFRPFKSQINYKKHLGRHRAIGHAN